MTDTSWQLWGTDDPTECTIWQRPAPDKAGEISGNNSGSGAVETEIRTPDGTVLLNTTDSFDWDYWGGVHVTLNPDGETAVLDINNQSRDIWRLATPGAPQKLLESWRNADDDDRPHVAHHPDGWRAQVQVLRRRIGGEDPAPTVGQVKVIDPSGQTTLDEQITLRCPYPHAMQAAVNPTANEVEISALGDGGERTTLPIPAKTNGQATE